jgi:predicted nucleic acid-binding protein
MDRFTALLDANVLYPAALRNLLMWLTLHGLFRAKWSERVHEEWIAAVLRERPDLDRQQLERTRDLMNLHAEDSLVEGFESLIDGLDLPDPDDRHVLAAAIRSGAEVIVTQNLKDFPAEQLDPYGIEAQHPDTFISHLIDLNRDAVVAAAREHRASLKNPPKTVTEYLDTLERQGLTQTVAQLREIEPVL